VRHAIPKDMLIMVEECLTKCGKQKRQVWSAQHRHMARWQQGLPAWPLTFLIGILCICRMI
jgi:hypothetical protein